MPSTYTLATLHGEGDVTEDGASGLCVFNSQALDVHLTVARPAVMGVRVVDDEVGAFFAAGFPQQWLF